MHARRAVQTSVCAPGDDELVRSGCAEADTHAAAAPPRSSNEVEARQVGAGCRLLANQRNGLVA